MLVIWASIQEDNRLWLIVGEWLLWVNKLVAEHSSKIEECSLKKIQYVASSYKIRLFHLVLKRYWAVRHSLQEWWAHKKVAVLVIKTNADKIQSLNNTLAKDIRLERFTGQWFFLIVFWQIRRMEAWVALTSPRGPLHNSHNMQILLSELIRLYHQSKRLKQGQRRDKKIISKLLWTM